MIYLHKILPLLVSPIVLILILLLLGVTYKRRSLIITAILMLYLASTPVVASFLLGWVETKQIKLSPDDAPQVDAIVVLSGTLSWTKTKEGLSPQWGRADRFFAGLDLMQSGHAEKLIFTAGKLPWDLGDHTEGAILNKYAQLFNIPADKIFVTDEVQNTEQEAREVARYLKGHGKRIVLVTSAFHMQRAKLLFEHQGLEVFAYPVDFEVSESALTPMSFLPHARDLSMTDLAIREVVGRSFYWVKNTLLPRI